MHQGQNRRKQKRKLSKKREWGGNLYINLVENAGIYNCFGNREGICNMHNWLRGMDAPKYENNTRWKKKSERTGGVERR